MYETDIATLKPKIDSQNPFLCSLCYRPVNKLTQHTAMSLWKPANGDFFFIPWSCLFSFIFIQEGESEGNIKKNYETCMKLTLPPYNPRLTIKILYLHSFVCYCPFFLLLPITPKCLYFDKMQINGRILHKKKSSHPKQSQRKTLTIIP